MFADPASVWQKDPAELFHTTKFGRMQAMMPPWRNRMNDDEIWNAVAYAWSLHTLREELELGADLYAAQCASCHGDGGSGDGPQAIGGEPDFTDQSYAVFRSQAEWLAGWQEAHPEAGAEWSTSDQAVTLEAVRSFSMTPPWADAYKPGSGTINGLVRQATEGGAAVEGSEVILDAFVGFDQVATFTTTVAANGAFVFSDLSTDPTINYIASVDTGDIGYSSDFIALSPLSQTVNSEVVVYETTDDPTALTLDRLHWIVETRPGVLLVGQIYLVGNQSDRTFVGQTVEGVDVPVTYAMAVPPEAQDLAFDNGSLGNRFQKVGDLVYDTLPVLPGEGSRQVVMRYAIPFDGTSTELKQDVLYPAGEVSLLVTDLPNLKLEADGVQFVSVEEMGDQSYQFWANENLEPQTLAVRLDGLLEAGSADPLASTGSSDQESAGAGNSEQSVQKVAPPMEQWLAYLIAAVVAGMLLGLLIWANSSGALKSRYSRDDLNALHDGLLDEIAKLDDLHALGAVNEGEWMRRRAHLKAQLVEVTGMINRGKHKTVISTA
jgi:mono/diheme cytochrome c family protein